MKRKNAARVWMATFNRLSGTSKYDLLSQQCSRWTVEKDKCSWELLRQWPGRHSGKKQAQNKNTKMEILRGKIWDFKDKSKKILKRGYGKTKKENCLSEHRNYITEII